MYLCYNRLWYLLMKVIDPENKEELHGYIQMVADEVTPDMAVDEGEEDEDEEDEEKQGEGLSDLSGEVSDATSEDDKEVEESDGDDEIDEEFRKEVKMALGDAALASGEVCFLMLHNLIYMLSQLCGS